MDYEKDLISMINDVSTHEFLHILTPLNLHSFEIANFNFTDPAMSKQLWMYEGVTEYFAQLVQLQNGLANEKKFFTEMRKKMNQAEEFGNFSMTEMSKNVMEDEYQKKYNSVYSRGALIGLLLDIYIRDKTNNQKTLKSVIVDLAHKYGPGKPFNDDRFIDEFVAASHPDVKLFMDKYVTGTDPLPYAEMLGKAGYEYQPTKNVDAYYPGKMGLKFDKPGNSFVFTGTAKNPLGIKDDDTFAEIDGKPVTPETVDELWDTYFDQNTEHPEITIKVIRNKQEKILQGKIFNGHFVVKNYLAPMPERTAAQTEMLKDLLNR
jgi:predicted metalloprotease with PDZ domain